VATTEKTNPYKKLGEMAVLPADTVGFCSDGFFENESARLGRGTLGKLDDEGCLMRTMILRTVPYFKENPEMDLERRLAALRGITHALARVESLYTVPARRPSMTRAASSRRWAS